MKYVLIIADGVSDLPVPELDGRTPLEAARTPNLDALAAGGRVGTVSMAGPPDEAALASALAIAGVDLAPLLETTDLSPAAIEAFAETQATWANILRVDFFALNAAEAVHFEPLDAPARPASDAFRGLVRDLEAWWREREPEAMTEWTVDPFAEGRALLVNRTMQEFGEPGLFEPQEASRRPWREHFEGQGSRRTFAARLIEHSATFFAERNRGSLDPHPPALAWIWDPGFIASLLKRPQSPVSGLAFVRDPHLVAAAKFIGWDLAPAAPDVTSDLRALAVAIGQALRSHDLIVCEVDGAREASLRGDWQAKVEAIEAIDRDLIGPVRSDVERFGNPEHAPGETGWRMLVLPRRSAHLSTRTLMYEPVPFVMAGAWVRSVVQRAFSERDGAASDLHIEAGHELLEYFLRSGLARTRA